MPHEGGPSRQVSRSNLTGATPSLTHTVTRAPQMGRGPATTWLLPASLPLLDAIRTLPIQSRCRRAAVPAKWPENGHLPSIGARSPPRNDRFCPASLAEWSPG
jgi:hypothetical protein